MELIITANACSVRLFKALVEGASGDTLKDSDLSHIPLRDDPANETSPVTLIEVGQGDAVMFMHYCIQCGQLYYSGVKCNYFFANSHEEFDAAVSRVSDAAALATLARARQLKQS